MFASLAQSVFLIRRHLALMRAQGAAMQPESPAAQPESDQEQQAQKQQALALRIATLPFAPTLRPAAIASAAQWLIGQVTLQVVGQLLSEAVAVLRLGGETA